MGDVSSQGAETTRRANLGGIKTSKENLRISWTRSNPTISFGCSDSTSTKPGVFFVKHLSRADDPLIFHPIFHRGTIGGNHRVQQKGSSWVTDGFTRAYFHSSWRLTPPASSVGPASTFVFFFEGGHIEIGLRYFWNPNWDTTTNIMHQHIYVSMYLCIYIYIYTYIS